MDKRLIAERFARARGTYSHEARVQQQVAEKMLQLLTERASPLFRRIVEFGCGTGSYSRLLLHKLQPEVQRFSISGNEPHGILWKQISETLFHLRT